MDLFSTINSLNSNPVIENRPEPVRNIKSERSEDNKEDFKSVLSQVKEDKTPLEKEGSQKKVTVEELQKSVQGLEDKIEKMKAKASPEQLQELEKIQDFLKQIKEILAKLKDSKVQVNLRNEGGKIDFFQMMAQLLQDLSQVLDSPQGLNQALHKLEGLDKKLEEIRSGISQKQSAKEEMKLFSDANLKEKEPVQQEAKEDKVKVIDNRSVRKDLQIKGGSTTVVRMEKNQDSNGLFTQQLNNLVKNTPQDNAGQNAQAEMQVNRQHTQDQARVEYTNFSSSVSRAHMESLMSNIAGRAVVTLGEGRSEVKMRLTPPELGNMNIKFSLEDGKMIGKIVVSTQEAKMLFDQNLWDLQKSLQNAGIDVQSLDVNVGQEDSGEKEAELFPKPGLALSGMESVAELSPLDGSGHLYTSSVNYIA